MKIKFTLAFLSLCFSSAISFAQTIYALNGNNLISFSASTPGAITSSVAITGITAGQAIEGMDFRPTTGELFVIGYNSASGAAQLYIVNRTSGAATAVNITPMTLATGIQQMGFDFNPTVDRIRVTGNTDVNYRLNPVTGTIAATDVNLAYAVSDPNSSANPSVGAVAYTNSYIGATSTTLYNYDYALNILTTQNPPNNGTLNTVGASGVTVNAADPTIDMDIYMDATLGNRCYLAANAGASANDNLYTVNLATGAATLIGTIGGGLSIRDIAVFIDRTLPSLTGKLVYGLTTLSTLISFDSANPNFIRSLTPVTGLISGDVLLAMDSRPATAEVFALAYNATSTMSQLYTINTMTAVATPVGIPVSLNLAGENIGFDFNPTVDRIRVTASGSNSNYRLTPAGTIAATDVNLAFAAGDPNQGKEPSIGAVAYTNNYAGALSTTLYDYDDSLNIFAIQSPPNNGTLNTVGTSGITLNPSDRSSGFDIWYDFSASTNKAYLSANPGSSTFDNLYTVNLSTGAVSLVGSIGFGIAVKDITFYIDTIPTGVEELSWNDGALLIYPNPTAGFLNVDSKIQNAELSIYNTLGELVHQQIISSTTQQINLSAQAKGIYFIELVADGKREKGKIILN